ncbi:uncharacterized protein IL334_007648 [Kwoniella shivajii]|uniref:Uncharacterized protein n=1 Tax=Kwoniella shivajii TaxID=564305 RepID=A0ABZ1D9T7_9TREE|nr:hypothetical protein IL334_007648 [Kwoniella shivajii]
MSTERTPLIVSGGVGPSNVRYIPSSTHFTLNDQASHLISDLKSSSAPNDYSSPNTRAELAVYLYALHLLDPKRYGTRVSVRARIAESEVGRKLRDILSDKIEDMLDNGCGIEDAGEESDVELQDIFLDRWSIKDGGKCVNALDLMLPPYTAKSRPSPFLSHPTVRHIIDLTWSNGILPKRDGKAQRRLSDRVGSIATPSRLHLLHLTSFCVLYGLTLHIALVPGERISPYDHDVSSGRNGLSSREVLWMILTGSHLYQAIQCPSEPIRFFMDLPLYLSLIFSLFPSFTQTAYNLILVSIPASTFLLILPYPPSIPILIQGVLPLSVLLRRILVRSVKTAGLVMPLVLGLFAIFSWSMNGDIFRGFITVSQSFPLSIPPPSMTEWTDSTFSISQLGEPIENGIAPFEARLSLFITLSLLFIFSLLLTAARAVLIPREKWDGNEERRWKGAIKEGDNWERGYGSVVGRESRQAWSEAVRWYVWEPTLHVTGNTEDVESSRRNYGASDIPGPERDEEIQPNDIKNDRWKRKLLPPKLPPPLNVITLPLDLLRLLPLKRLNDQLDEAIYTISVGTAGVVCLPFHVFSIIGSSIWRNDE